MTEMLKKHDHIQRSKAVIAAKIRTGATKGVEPYKLNGLDGIGKYLKDYSTLLTGGATGNLAVTYLGSYSLEWSVTVISRGVASVKFRVDNSSTMQSATRLPYIGYKKWWRKSIGKWINNLFSSGPGSETTQTFRWTEKIKLK